MNKRNLPGILASTLVFSGWILSGCGGETPPAPPPPEVTVATPERRTVVNYLEFTGSTRAIESVEVRARVGGRLESFHFTSGEMVEKGDLLFTIERDQYRALRDAAEGGLKSAEANLARAKSDLARIEQAIQTKAVSEQDLDRARADLLQAEADVLSNRAHLDQAELDYSYTLVKSPIAGQVSRNLVDSGNLVGQTEATLLTTVNKMQPMYVYFDAPEHLVLRLLAAVGDTAVSEEWRDLRGKAWVKTAVDTGFPHEGRIDYIDNTVDPTTGTISIRAELPNEPALLFPGLFVRIRVTAGVGKDAVLVSERAVGTDIGGKYVYVVGEDNLVEQRYLRMGSAQSDGSVVVEEGLTGTETYIVNGLLRARPGLPVTPRTPQEMEARKQAASGGGK